METTTSTICFSWTVIVIHNVASKPIYIHITVVQCPQSSCFEPLTRVLCQTPVSCVRCFCVEPWPVALAASARQNQRFHCQGKGPWNLWKSNESSFTCCDVMQWDQTLGMTEMEDWWLMHGVVPVMWMNMCFLVSYRNHRRCKIVDQCWYISTVHIENDTIK